MDKEFTATSFPFPTLSWGSKNFVWTKTRFSGVEFNTRKFTKTRLRAFMSKNFRAQAPGSPFKEEGEERGRGKEGGEERRRDGMEERGGTIRQIKFYDYSTGYNHCTFI
jgi:hypothetical protein